MQTSWDGRVAGGACASPRKAVTASSTRGSTNDNTQRCHRGGFTLDSIEAASYIYEDCRARGQSAEQAMSKAVGRLVPSAEGDRSERERLAKTVERVANEQKIYREETIKDLRAAAVMLRSTLSANRPTIQELKAIFPLLWHINDHLSITPDQGVEYTGSTNDVDRLRLELHKLDPNFDLGTVHEGQEAADVERAIKDATASTKSDHG